MATDCTAQKAAAQAGGKSGPRVARTSYFHGLQVPCCNPEWMAVRVGFVHACKSLPSGSLLLLPLPMAPTATESIHPSLQICLTCDHQNICRIQLNCCLDSVHIFCRGPPLESFCSTAIQSYRPKSSSPRHTHAPHHPPHHHH